jgi:hypothetical protein
MSCRDPIMVRSFFVHRRITGQSYGRAAGHQAVRGAYMRVR